MNDNFKKEKDLGPLSLGQPEASFGRSRARKSYGAEASESSQSGRTIDGTRTGSAEGAINTQDEGYMAMRDLEKFIQGLEDRVPVFTAPDSSAQTNRTEAKDDLGQLTSAPLPNQ